MCSLTWLFKKHGKERRYVSNIKVKSSWEYLPYQSYHTSTNLNKRWDSTLVGSQTKQKKERQLHTFYYKIKKGCCIFES